jgi:hypothetical protein
MPLVANTNEKSLRQLADILKIGSGEGWKSELAKALGRDRTTLSTWISRGIPKSIVVKMTNRGISPDSWLLPNDEKDSYPHQDDSIHNSESHEPFVGSYGMHDLAGQSVKTVYEPAGPKSHAPPDEFLYLQKVSEILRSGKPGVAEALKSNILQFHEMVRMSDRLQALEAQRARDDTEKADMKEAIKKLEKALTRERNFDIGPAGCTAQTGSDDT